MFWPGTQQALPARVAFSLVTLPDLSLTFHTREDSAAAGGGQKEANAVITGHKHRDTNTHEDGDVFCEQLIKNYFPS